MFFLNPNFIVLLVYTWPYIFLLPPAPILQSCYRLKLPGYFLVLYQFIEEWQNGYLFLAGCRYSESLEALWVCKVLLLLTQLRVFRFLLFTPPITDVHFHLLCSWLVSPSGLNSTSSFFTISTQMCAFNSWLIFLSLWSAGVALYFLTAKSQGMQNQKEGKITLAASIFFPSRASQLFFFTWLLLIYCVSIFLFATQNYIGWRWTAILQVGCFTSIQLLFIYSI